jgi:hypothetical protein
VFGRAHVERVAAVRFIAGGFGRDGYVYVVILGTKSAAMLVLLHTGDIDEKGNPRHVVEL